MNHDYYAMLAFTFVLLYLQPTNCSLSTVVRYKRATGNTAQTSVGEIEQITENPESQTSDHESFIKKCELLTQYLEAFNNAITEESDKRKSGLGKKFEMIFPNSSSNEANNSFYAMLKVEFEKESAIVNGKPETIAALQKISLGRNAFKLGKKDYMPSDQATSIVETTLHANWASVVGGYLENKQKEYLLQLVEVIADATVSSRYHPRVPTQGQASRASPPPNPVDPLITLEQHLNKVRSNTEALKAMKTLKTRLEVEAHKIERHMISIRALLSKAEKFFEKLAAPPEKKSLKLSHKLGIGRSDGAQYSQMGKFEGVFNPSAKLEIFNTLLSSLEAVFGPVRAD